jgi:hypothetical protein
MSEVIKKASELRVGARITFYDDIAKLMYGTHVYTYAGGNLDGVHFFDDGKRVIKTKNVKVVVL